MSAHRTAVSALRLLLPLLLLACARGHTHAHNHGHGHGHGHGHHHPPTPMPAVIDADTAAAAVSAWSGSGQVTAPYPEGTTLGLGSGFDVTGWGAVKQTGAIDSGTATATTSYQNTVSATKFLATAGTDINTKLSISSQASMSYGAFSANTDVSFTRQIDRSSRSFTYLSEYSIQFGQLLYSAQPTLSATALNLLQTKGVSAFVTAYGQYYAYAITSGSRLLARSSVSTSSEEMTTALSVSVSVSGSYGAFSASVTANVQNDESIQTFTTTQQDAITYQGVDLTCMGGGPPSSADGAQDPTPDAMDALIAKYQSCVASVASSPGAGIPVQVVLARFDELPDWISGGFPAIVTNNSILVDNSALADAATLVNHYDSIFTDSTAYLAQGGVPPTTATALQTMNAAIRASRAQVLAGLTLSEADLETLLATLPFWGTYQTTYNRLIGDFRWSSCDWNKVQNPGANGDVSTQQCPSSQTVPIVGGTVCRPSWDTMLMYSYGTPAANGQNAGWYSQCMNHDNDALSAGQSLFLSCCYAPLLGSCSPVVSTNSATLSCPSQSQVLIGLGATCNQGYDAMLYQLEPASTYSANGQCMNHHNDAQSNPTSMSGYCCTMPQDATARYVQVTGDGTNPSTVSCNANEVLVNGGTTCPRAADQFILQSYPSSLSTWSGYCINHQNSGLQGPPVSSSAVCVSFSEDQPSALDDLGATAGHGHRHSGYAAAANNGKPKAPARATVAPVSYNVTAGAPSVPGRGVGAPALATVSATAPQQLVHYALNPPPVADLTIAYRTTCNVELGANGNVRVTSSGRCVHDTVSGTITVPRGASFASVQVLRPGGARWQAAQHGVVEFVGRVKSEDVMWRRPATLFTPIRVVIKH